jgi:hypothetical protein
MYNLNKLREKKREQAKKQSIDVSARRASDAA